MPTLLVALYSVGPLSRIVRIELLLLVRRPYFLTALAKGLSRTRALAGHGGGHAMFAILTLLTPQMAWAIGGTAVVEIVFAVPGISQFLVESVAARDYLVLQAYVMLIALWMVAVHSLAGGLRMWLDPTL